MSHALGRQRAAVERAERERRSREEGLRQANRRLGRGGDEELLPEHLRIHPRFGKPVDAEPFVRTLRELAAGHGSDAGGPRRS
jgi:hypothetical protein